MCAAQVLLSEVLKETFARLIEARAETAEADAGVVWVPDVTAETSADRDKSLGVSPTVCAQRERSARVLRRLCSQMKTTARTVRRLCSRMKMTARTVRRLGAHSSKAPGVSTEPWYNREMFARTADAARRRTRQRCSSEPRDWLAGRRCLLSLGPLCGLPTCGHPIRSRRHQAASSQKKLG